MIVFVLFLVSLAGVTGLITLTTDTGRDDINGQNVTITFGNDMDIWNCLQSIQTKARGGSRISDLNSPFHKKGSFYEVLIVAVLAICILTSSFFIFGSVVIKKRKEVSTEQHWVTVGSKSTVIINQDSFITNCTSEIQTTETYEVRTILKSEFMKDTDVTLRRNDLDLLRDTMKSVGILFTNDEGKGTVVRIGKSYVITAWHVIRDIVLPIESRFNNRGIDESFLENSDIFTDFHESCRNSPDHMHFGFKPVIVFKDEALDIVILELDCTGKEAFIPPPISKFADVVDLNTRVTKVTSVLIIGQHPSKLNVVLDPGCKIISRDDPNIHESRKWIKQNMSYLKKEAKNHGIDPTAVERAYYDVYDSSNRLVFDTFLNFGGSGGAVVALVPDGGVALVAILTHGIPAPLYAKFPYPDFMKKEVGTTLKAIKQSFECTDHIKTSMIKTLFCADNKGHSISEPMETEQASYSILDETSVSDTDSSFETITQRMSLL